MLQNSLLLIIIYSDKKARAHHGRAQRHSKNLRSEKCA
jgi:hypothetical protein